MNAAQYKEFLHGFDCVVCLKLLGKRNPIVQTHHVESIRDKDSDFAMAPLCVDHHSELHQLSRRGFARRHGLDDIDLLKLTIKALAEKL